MLHNQLRTFTIFVPLTTTKSNLKTENIFYELENPPCMKTVSDGDKPNFK